MTGPVSISEAPTAGIGKMLMESRFMVPNHQRDYSWDEDRVGQFLDDLLDAMARGDNFYFVGLMVFMSSQDGRLTVLDGQQRLATAVIIIAAMRAWFGGIAKYAKNANRLQEDFIGRAELGEQEIQPKLTLNYYNNTSFQELVVAGAPLDEVARRLAALKRSDPNRALLAAISNCHRRVADIAAKAGDTDAAAKFLIKLAVYIRDNVLAVRLTVPSEANAFRVFETLNDRGQELSSMDLVKNHLFGLALSHSQQRLGELEQRWAQMMATLSSSKADDFLKVFWTSRHGRVQSADLFQEVKKRCQDHAQATALSQDLLEAADHYAALEQSDDQVWAPYTPAVRNSIRTLKLIGSKQVRPIILSAIKKFAPAELERLLWLLEVILVRYQLVGGERTGILEISCAKLAKGIFDGTITTATHAHQQTSDIYTKDEQFKASFAVKQELTNTKSQYVLRHLEQERRRLNLGAKAGEEGVGENLSVEHILPRTPSAEWNSIVDADKSIAEDCADRLGNLCLLTEKLNRDVGRANFEEKKKVYGTSDLMTTADLANLPQWDRRAIEHRQAEMAKRAVAIWRFQ